MMVVFGHALNSILGSSGAAVKMIASINKSTEKPIGTALAGLRLRHRNVPNTHPLLIQKILTTQVAIYLLSIKINMLRVLFDSDPVIFLYCYDRLL
jgi:hypothetical protein